MNPGHDGPPSDPALFETADPPAVAVPDPPRHRSAAVHQKRDIPREGELDYFPTPPWATLALMAQLGIEEGSSLTCCEPAAGGGHMSDVLEGFFAAVDSSDIADPEGRGWGGRDFLTAAPPPVLYDWLITNPPFKLADQFAVKGLAHARNMALLCRIAFLEGQRRHDNLFSRQPPSEVAVFSQRLTILKGRVDEQAAGGAVCYAWFIWRDGHDGPPAVTWITHSPKNPGHPRLTD